MGFSAYNQENRVRRVNQKPEFKNGKYILYWMQAYRRLDWNHSLDFAIHKSIEMKKPLVIYEGLRMDYKWNSSRIHKFILDGIIDNESRAKKLGIHYWPFVETKENSAKGILRSITKDACLVVTDDFPAFIIPDQIERANQFLECAFFAVDSNCMIPLGLYGEVASAARILRYRVHKLFAQSYVHRANPSPNFQEIVNAKLSPPFRVFHSSQKQLESVLQNIDFSNSVLPVKDVIGGTTEAKKLLKSFLEKSLTHYGDLRSNPNPPENTPSSFLSPYLHFGHISVEEIVTEVLNFGMKKKWTPDLLNSSFSGKRESFFHKEKFVNSFLDELITWRDVGYLLFWKKKEFSKDLEVLPDWIKDNYKKHAKDSREYLYTLEEFENAKTHDPLWNAAQLELIHTGRMHNYMRMLWGKKVIEWSATYKEAFDTLEYLNNKYAYDGRNPNSYTGILWCFGLFDRPWFPERNVFGTVRYMSSDSTKKKFKMDSYLQYIKKLSNKEKNLFGD
jgi:deoxyribodipyrimidine photo-lyase